MNSLRRRATLSIALSLGIAFGASGQTTITAPPSTEPAASMPAAPSLSARKVYEQARSQLVQIRTVLKGRASQTSVGSGFFITREGHIVTNFHVVAEAALKPERHDLVYVTADGREAPLQILQLDVLHDLALLKAGDAGARTFDALAFRTDAQPLSQGERIYSLGNPLDVGFAVTEGTYNGLVKRSFYPQIFFGGSLSGGMSGGPALDNQGFVIGINVARRVDGEQVSFLVPASFAVALLARARDAAPIKTPAYPIVTTQLLQHQAALTERFIQQGWKPATHPRYRVPVPSDEFMRCWGSSDPSRTGGLDVERSNCVMDTRIFVGDYTTGAISVRHESYDGSKLGTLRGTLRRFATKISRACAASTRPSRNAMKTSSTAAGCRCARSCACAPTRSCPSSTTCRCWSPRSTRPRPACRAASTRRD